jgi:hypothetical protein
VQTPQHTSKQFRADRVAVMKAVKNNGWALQACTPAAPTARRADCAPTALRLTPRLQTPQWAGGVLRGDYDVVKAAVENGRHPYKWELLQVNVLQWASPDLRTPSTPETFKLVMTAIEAWPLSCWSVYSDGVRGDKLRELALAAVKDWSSLVWVNHIFHKGHIKESDYRSILVEACKELQKNGAACLKESFAPMTFSAPSLGGSFPYSQYNAFLAFEPDSDHFLRIFDAELARLAVLGFAPFFLYLPPEFQTKELALEAVRQDGSLLSKAHGRMFFPEQFQGDIEVVKAAVSNYARAYTRAAYPLQRNKDVISLALNTSGKVLAFVPRDLVTEEVATIAVTQDGDSLQYLPEDLQFRGADQNYRLFLAAVQSNGLALKHVHEFMTLPGADELVWFSKKHFEICLAAVRQNGLALRYIADYLVPNEFDRVRHKDPFYVPEVDERGEHVLKDEPRELILEALRQTWHAAQHVPKWFRENEAVRAAASVRSKKCAV